MLRVYTFPTSSALVCLQVASEFCSQASSSLPTSSALFKKALMAFRNCASASLGCGKTGLDQVNKKQPYLVPLFATKRPATLMAHDYSGNGMDQVEH